jgi:hypothetical protein
MPNAPSVTCALCCKRAPLLNSHIIPAFVFRWQIESGGHIRSSDAPNLRVQDGLKVPMLCAECEGEFSKYENAFATRLFYPLDNDIAQVIPYGEWMLRFCVSVSWRILHHEREIDGLRGLAPAQLASAARALDWWSDFLQGRKPHPGKYEQHLLRFQPIRQRFHSGLPTNANRYFLRVTDVTIGFADSTVFTYAKLGPVAILGFVEAPAGEWRATRVCVRYGASRPLIRRPPRAVEDFLWDRARRAGSEMYEQMSDNQIEKISADGFTNIDKLAASDLVKAVLLDAELFGEGAVLLPRRGTR